RGPLRGPRGSATGATHEVANRSLTPWRRAGNNRRRGDGPTFPFPRRAHPGCTSIVDRGAGPGEPRAFTVILDRLPCHKLADCKGDYSRYRRLAVPSKW